MKRATSPGGGGFTAGFARHDTQPANNNLHDDLSTRSDAWIEKALPGIWPAALPPNNNLLFPICQFFRLDHPSSMGAVVKEDILLTIGVFALPALVIVGIHAA